LPRCGKSKRGDATLREPKGTIWFVTGNKAKYAEASRVADRFGVRLKQLPLGKIEIQADDLQEIAGFAAKQACQATRRPVVAEDSGFFVDALGGFPGPYSSYVYKTVGNDGILRLMRSDDNRLASFRATVAFCRPRSRPVCFSGIVAGKVARRPKGTRGFGFDPIFIPVDGDGRTFGQMKTEEKNLLSHRAKAFGEFFKWFLTGRG
jgi:XTP/dITP diphosphohydrolase